MSAHTDARGRARRRSRRGLDGGEGTTYRGAAPDGRERPTVGPASCPRGVPC